MADRSPVFPLRLRDRRLRALVREVAQREGISQNQLIEQAIEDDMVIRGRLLAAELQTVADRLDRLAGEAHAEVVARSMQEFAEGESRPDPLASSALHRDTPRRQQPVPAEPTDIDRFGVLAAFRAGHR